MSLQTVGWVLMFLLTLGSLAPERDKGLHKPEFQGKMAGLRGDMGQVVREGCTP